MVVLKSGELFPVLYSPSNKKKFVRGFWLSLFYFIFFPPLRFGRICSQPCLPVASLCVSCVPSPVACAMELTPKWVIQMSRLWPSSLFVLAVTFFLSLCQDYPLHWVLPLVSLGRVTLRHLLASWYQARRLPSAGTSHREIWVQGTKQACSCPFLSV